MAHHRVCGGVARFREVRRAVGRLPSQGDGFLVEGGGPQLGRARLSCTQAGLSLGSTETLGGGGVGQLVIRRGGGDPLAVDSGPRAAFRLASSHTKKPMVPTATATPTVANAVG